MVKLSHFFQYSVQIFTFYVFIKPNFFEVKRLLAIVLKSDIKLLLSFVYLYNHLVLFDRGLIIKVKIFYFNNELYGI